MLFLFGFPAVFESNLNDINWVSGKGAVLLLNIFHMVRLMWVGCGSKLRRTMKFTTNSVPTSGKWHMRRSHGCFWRLGTVGTQSWIRNNPRALSRAAYIYKHAHISSCAALFPQQSFFVAPVFLMMAVTAATFNAYGGLAGGPKRPGWGT